MDHHITGAPRPHAPRGLDKHLSELGENAREVIAEAASAIRSRFNGDVREIGERLAAVKDVLPHGAFGPWVAHELGITPRTAQNYMNAAGFLTGKSETVSHLPPAILYKLAAPTALPVLVDKVVQATEQGDTIDLAALKKALALHGAVLRYRKQAADLLRGVRVSGRTIGKEARANQARVQNGYADREEAELAALPIVKGVPT